VLWVSNPSRSLSCRPGPRSGTNLVHDTESARLMSLANSVDLHHFQHQEPMSAFFVGIDASKGYADFVILDHRRRIVEPAFQLDDTFEGHARLYQILERICLTDPEAEVFAAVESTGGYENNWLDALMRFQATLPVKAARINPSRIHSYREAKWFSPVFVDSGLGCDSHGLGEHFLFVLGRALIAQARVSSFSIVPHFDELEDLSAGVLSSTEAVAVNELLLQRREEAFHRGVVPAVALAAHADHAAGLGEHFLIVRTRVLAPPVAVVQQAPAGSTVRQSSLQSGYHQ